LQEIKFILFADHDPVPVIEPDETNKYDEAFKCADFIVADNTALICLLESRTFEELDPENKRVK